MVAIDIGVGGGSTDPIRIMGNIFVSFIGAGVLGLPYAFKQAGIMEGTVTIIVVSALAIKAMLLLIECKYTVIHQKRKIQHQTVPLIENGDDSASNEQLPDYQIKSSPTKKHADDNLTYADIGFYAMGNVGALVVESSILVSQIGFCCAYLIFIQENLHTFFPSTDQRILLLSLMPFIYLLTLYRKLHNLAAFSLFAQFSNLLAFAVVFWFDFEHMAHATTRSHPDNWSLNGFPFFFAVAIYCYEGAGMILSLEGSVAKSKRHEFAKYFLIVLTSVTVLYISFGVSGYMSFGADTRDIITLNLPQSDGLSAEMIVKLCLCVALLLTYPVMMFPVTEMLQRKWLRASKNPDARLFCAENLLRLCLVVVTTLVVIAIPSFANLMALIGATCCSLLAFILPGYFHMKLHQGQISTTQEYFDMFLVMFGLFGAMLGTADTLNNIRNKPSPPSAFITTSTKAQTTFNVTSN